MLSENPEDYRTLYNSFHSPISIIDCGEKCAPYNEGRVPFCCDTRHAVPTAYLTEWNYLQEETNLWHLWSSSDSKEVQRMRSETPDGQVLIECLGHTQCQRNFRSVTCRAFPFFPYISRRDEFLGLSHYWEYTDRCWVISHPEVVNPEYRSEFISAYEQIFAAYPQEKENFCNHSLMIRRIYGRRHQAIPLLHRNGYAYKITPHNGRLRRVPVNTFPRYGQYRVASKLSFRDELEA